MKRMALIVLLSIAALSSAALAVEPDTSYGIEVGIRDQSGDVPAGYSANSQIGYQFGGTVHIPISGPWALRTGMLYTQRPLVATNSLTNVQTKVTLDYLDVPLAVMYKFEDYAGIFAGVSVAMNIDHNSADNSAFPVTGTKSMILPILFGANFKFAPHLGGTIYFETYGGNVADNLSNYRAVGANLYLTFD